MSYEPGMQLAFSVDTVRFDTVFTAMGSSTQQVMVYNNNRNALIISSVSLDGKYFKINLDGENNPERLKDIQLNGGDSIFLFIRVNIDPQAANTPVLVTDTLRFVINGEEQTLPMEAYGQNVTVIRTPSGRSEYAMKHTFTADLPYLIYDTVVCNGPLVMEEGATLYMHHSAAIIANNQVTAKGSKERPIRLLGDRTDHLFDSVPYRVASGQWIGFYLLQTNPKAPIKYTFDYVEILSGNVGLYCACDDKSRRPQLTLTNSRIHNHAVYGLVVQNVDAEIVNTEISNCAAYCLYLCGGNQTITHSTIASFFGWPNSDLNIHSVGREDVAAVYIDNLDKNQAETNVSIRNSIITGVRKNNLVVATPLPDYYGGQIYGNYIKNDTLSADWCYNNVYAQDSDSVFVNTHYLYHQYRYFDFRLDSLSPARAIGDSVIGEQYPLDRNGLPRNGRKPDAGCYQL